MALHQVRHYLEHFNGLTLLSIVNGLAAQEAFFNGRKSEDVCVVAALPLREILHYCASWFSVTDTGEHTQK